MKAILEPRMVPARIHVLDSARHGSAALADRMIVSSHGVLIESMDATQRTFVPLRPFSHCREASGCDRPALPLRCHPEEAESLSLRETSVEGTLSSPL